MRTFQVSNFGTKTTTGRFEDFESFSTGVKSGSVGPIQLGSGASEVAIDGSKVIRHNFGVYAWPHNYVELSGTQKSFYFSARVKITGSLAGDTLWKMGRIGAGEVYGGTPRSGESWQASNGLPQVFVGEQVDGTGAIVGWAGYGNIPARNKGAAANSAHTAYKKDRWVMYEFVFYAGDVGQSNSETRVLVDGHEVLLWSTIPYLSAAGQLPTWFLTPLNGIDNAGAIAVSMDDMYMDESRARVVLTDSADYYGSTVRDAQPIVSSTSSSVTVKLRGSGNHVHVWRTDGSYTYLGTL